MRRITKGLQLIGSGKYQFLLWKLSPGLLRGWYRLRGMSAAESFSAMQKLVYEEYASVDAKNLVVGAFAEHEQYDYETPLLRTIRIDPGAVVALDFACGPGRMVKRMSRRVARCDGVDISAENIRQAKEYCAATADKNRWYVNEGRTLAAVPSATYDLVYSTIALQHIPIHTIRQSLFAEMFRVLKPGGWLSVQMGYGRSLNSLVANEATCRCGADHFAHWSDDAYDALGTNGVHDVAITDDALPAVAADFASLGFQDFEYTLEPPTNPTIHWEKWIFLAARKPG